MGFENFQFPGLTKVLWILGAALFVGGMSGCGATAPGAKAAKRPTLPLNARPPTTARLSELEISQGGKLCAAKCVRCHQLYDPAAYSSAEWESWMIKMIKKAHLKPDQAALLSRYLKGFRSE